MLKKIFLIVLLFLYTTQIYGAKNSRSLFKSPRNRKISIKKTCSQKAPYSELGKSSKINGKIKTKSVSGYFKPSNSYKFVNPYARSK